jgi:hypothetical protein
MSVEVGERRFAQLGSEARATSAGQSPDASAAHGPDGLDWQAFTTAYFPGRRRHDLEALIAYSVHKRSRPGARSSGDPTSIERARGRNGSIALRRWENEGGATLPPGRR